MHIVCVYTLKTDRDTKADVDERERKEREITPE